MGTRLRIGTANVGTMRGRSDEILEIVKRRCPVFVACKRLGGKEGVLEHWAVVRFSGWAGRRGFRGWCPCGRELDRKGLGS